MVSKDEGKTAYKANRKESRRSFGKHTGNSHSQQRWQNTILNQSDLHEIRLLKSIWLPWLPRLPSFSRFRQVLAEFGSQLRARIGHLDIVNRNPKLTESCAERALHRRKVEATKRSKVREMDSSSGEPHCPDSNTTGSGRKSGEHSRNKKIKCQECVTCLNLSAGYQKIAEKSPLSTTHASQAPQGQTNEPDPFVLWTVPKSNLGLDDVKRNDAEATAAGTTTKPGIAPEWFLKLCDNGGLSLQLDSSFPEQLLTDSKELENLALTSREIRVNIMSHDDRGDDPPGVYFTVKEALSSNRNVALKSSQRVLETREQGQVRANSDGVVDRKQMVLKNKNIHNAVKKQVRVVSAAKQGRETKFPRNQRKRSKLREHHCHVSRAPFDEDGELKENSKNKLAYRGGLGENCTAQEKEVDEFSSQDIKANKISGRHQCMFPHIEALKDNVEAFSGERIKTSSSTRRGKHVKPSLLSHTIVRFNGMLQRFKQSIRKSVAASFRHHKENAGATQNGGSTIGDMLPGRVVVSTTSQFARRDVNRPESSSSDMAGMDINNSSLAQADVYAYFVDRPGGRIPDGRFLKFDDDNQNRTRNTLITGDGEQETRRRTSLQRRQERDTTSDWRTKKQSCSSDTIDTGAGRSFRRHDELSPLSQMRLDLHQFVHEEWCKEGQARHASTSSVGSGCDGYVNISKPDEHGVAILHSTNNYFQNKERQRCQILTPVSRVKVVKRSFKNHELPEIHLTSECGKDNNASLHSHCVEDRNYYHKTKTRKTLEMECDAFNFTKNKEQGPSKCHLPKRMKNNNPSPALSKLQPLTSSNTRKDDSSSEDLHNLHDIVESYFKLIKRNEGLEWSERLSTVGERSTDTENDPMKSEKSTDISNAHFQASSEISSTTEESIPSTFYNFPFEVDLNGSSRSSLRTKQPSRACRNNSKASDCETRRKALSKDTMDHLTRISDPTVKPDNIVTVSYSSASPDGDDKTKDNNKMDDLKHSLTNMDTPASPVVIPNGSSVHSFVDVGHHSISGSKKTRNFSISADLSTNRSQNMVPSNYSDQEQGNGQQRSSPTQSGSPSNRSLGFDDEGHTPEIPLNIKRGQHNFFSEEEETNSSEGKTSRKSHGLRRVESQTLSSFTSAKAPQINGSEAYRGASSGNLSSNSPIVRTSLDRHSLSSDDPNNSNDRNTSQVDCKLLYRRREFGQYMNNYLDAIDRHRCNNDFKPWTKNETKTPKVSPVKRNDFGCTTIADRPGSFSARDAPCLRAISPEGVRAFRRSLETKQGRRSLSKNETPSIRPKCHTSLTPRRYNRLGPCKTQTAASRCHYISERSKTDSKPTNEKESPSEKGEVLSPNNIMQLQLQVLSFMNQILSTSMLQTIRHCSSISQPAINQPGNSLQLASLSTGGWLADNRLLDPSARCTDTGTLLKYAHRGDSGVALEHPLSKSVQDRNKPPPADTECNCDEETKNPRVQAGVQTDCHAIRDCNGWVQTGVQTDCHAIRDCDICNCPPMASKPTTRRSNDGSETSDLVWGSEPSSANLPETEISRCIQTNNLYPSLAPVDTRYSLSNRPAFPCMGKIRLNKKCQVGRSKIESKQHTRTRCVQANEGPSSVLGERAFGSEDCHWITHVDQWMHCPKTGTIEVCADPVPKSMADAGTNTQCISESLSIRQRSKNPCQSPSRSQCPCQAKRKSGMMDKQDYSSSSISEASKRGSLERKNRVSCYDYQLVNQAPDSISTSFKRNKETQKSKKCRSSADTGSPIIHIRYRSRKVPECESSKGNETPTEKKQRIGEDIGKTLAKVMTRSLELQRQLTQLQEKQRPRKEAGNCNTTPVTSPPKVIEVCYDTPGMTSSENINSNAKFSPFEPDPDPKIDLDTRTAATNGNQSLPNTGAQESTRVRLYEADATVPDITESPPVDKAEGNVPTSLQSPGFGQHDFFPIQRNQYFELDKCRAMPNDSSEALSKAFGTSSQQGECSAIKGPPLRNRNKYNSSLTEVGEVAREKAPESCISEIPTHETLMENVENALGNTDHAKDSNINVCFPNEKRRPTKVKTVANLKAVEASVAPKIHSFIEPDVTSRPTRDPVFRKMVNVPNTGLHQPTDSSYWTSHWDMDSIGLAHTFLSVNELNEKSSHENRRIQHAGELKPVRRHPNVKCSPGHPRGRNEELTTSDKPFLKNNYPKLNPGHSSKGVMNEIDHDGDESKSTECGRLFERQHSTLPPLRVDAWSHEKDASQGQSLPDVKWGNLFSTRNATADENPCTDALSESKSSTQGIEEIPLDTDSFDFEKEKVDEHETKVIIPGAQIQNLSADASSFVSENVSQKNRFDLQNLPGVRKINTKSGSSKIDLPKNNLHPHSRSAKALAPLRGNEAKKEPEPFTKGQYLGQNSAFKVGTSSDGLHSSCTVDEITEEETNATETIAISSLPKMDSHSSHTVTHLIRSTDLCPPKATRDCSVTPMDKPVQHARPSASRSSRRLPRDMRKRVCLQNAFIKWSKGQTVDAKALRQAFRRKYLGDLESLHEPSSRAGNSLSCGPARVKGHRRLQFSDDFPDKKLTESRSARKRQKMTLSKSNNLLKSQAGEEGHHPALNSDADHIRSLPFLTGGASGTSGSINNKPSRTPAEPGAFLDVGGDTDAGDRRVVPLVGFGHVVEADVGRVVLEGFLLKRTTGNGRAQPSSPGHHGDDHGFLKFLLVVFRKKPNPDGKTAVRGTYKRQMETTNKYFKWRFNTMKSAIDLCSRDREK